MLSHLCVISSGTTVKLGQAFQDVLAEFWLLNESCLHQASTRLRGPVSCFVPWVTWVTWKVANICWNSIKVGTLEPACLGLNPSSFAD